MNSSPTDNQPGAERRIDKRYPVTTEAQIARTDASFWQANATVVNISANGLLLSIPCRCVLDIGAKVVVRFGPTVVRGNVRHLTLNADRLLVGISIDDAQFG